SGAHAGLPAAGRAGLRRARARPGLRCRRLLRAAGQTTCRYPISQAIAVGIGGHRNGRWNGGRRPMSAPAVIAHAWLPRAKCDTGCVGLGNAAGSGPRVVLRVTLRCMLALLLAPGVPLVAIPVPGRTRVQRVYCRLVLRCFGVRIRVSGNPIRNLRGVLVVSGHMSWLDVFAIGSVLPGSFVARADMFTGPAIGIVARILKIIPIERASLRGLPGVV